MPHIDWTISAGNLITLFVGLGALYMRISDRMKTMETKVDTIWAWLVGQLPDVPGRTASVAPNVYVHGRKAPREDHGRS